MLRNPSICDACARLRLRRDYEAQTTADTWTPYCDAFPGKVPDAIFLGGFDHRKEYPGDDGIRFVLREGGEDMLRMYESLTDAP